MAHPRCAWREDRQIGATVTLQFELILLDAFADFVVRYFQRGARRHRGLVARAHSRRMSLAETMQILGFGGVVAVAIDDHETAPFRGLESSDARAHFAIVKQRDCQTRQLSNAPTRASKRSNRAFMFSF